MPTTRITAQEYEEYSDDNMGYCARCRDFTTDCVEPDAEMYECESCGGNTVYGVEVAMIIGLFVVSR